MMMTKTMVGTFSLDKDFERWRHGNWSRKSALSSNRRWSGTWTVTGVGDQRKANPPWSGEWDHGREYEPIKTKSGSGLAPRTKERARTHTMHYNNFAGVPVTTIRVAKKPTRVFR